MFGMLFGLLDFILAVPAMIVLTIVLQRLNVKGVLEEGS